MLFRVTAIDVKAGNVETTENTLFNWGEENEFCFIKRAGSGLY